MSKYLPREVADARLAELEALLPKILADYPERDQAEVIAAEGEDIRERAAPEDRDYVFDRVEAMLVAAGLIPRAAPDRDR